LGLAFSQSRVLVTNDKDFGEMIFREGKAHKGAVLLRLNDERAANKIAVLSQVLNHHADDLADNFVVATEVGIRIVRT